jgi:hypothetical protein
MPLSNPLATTVADISSVQNALYGAAGIAAYPGAAAAANDVSLAEVLRYIQESQLGTLTNTGGTATLGAILGDMANEPIYNRLYELERHFHGYERWLCAAVTPNAEVHVADRIGSAATAVSPFTVTSGNDTWGSWVQILGSSDTPVIATHTKYDLHRLLVLVANQVSPYFVQIGFGASGAAALAADTFSSTVINPASNTDKTEALPFMSRRQAAGTKTWIRCWCVGANAKTLTVMFGLHEYLV